VTPGERPAYAERVNVLSGGRRRFNFGRTVFIGQLVAALIGLGIGLTSGGVVGFVLIVLALAWVVAVAAYISVGLRG
jgi:hypothetical protein